MADDGSDEWFPAGWTVDVRVKRSGRKDRVRLDFVSASRRERGEKLRFCVLPSINSFRCGWICSVGYLYLCALVLVSPGGFSC